MKIPFLTKNLIRQAGSQALPEVELQNLYPALENEQRALVRPGPALVQVPGTFEFTDLGSVALRGLFCFPGAGDGDLYAVGGTTLYRIDSLAAATNIGTITGSDPVIFDMIRDTVILSANGLAYYTTGGARTQITDPDLGTVTSVAGMDGRLLASVDATDTFVWSEVFDPGNIDSLSFATAETYGDDLQRVVTNESGLVYLFGKRSVEVWQRTGVSTAPFARIGSMVYPYGCPARHSIAKHGGKIFFVGASLSDGSPFIGMLSPQFERISEPGLELTMRLTYGESIVAAARAFAYMHDGGTFYQITFANQATWCFHLESRTWFRRRKGTDSVWHSSCFAEAFGYPMVGSDSADGKIWRMLSGISTDAGDSLIRIATAFIPVERPTPIETLFVDTSSLTSSAHTATVEISQDGGVNYRTSRTVSLDAPGGRKGPTFCWGSLRRPGGLVRVTTSANQDVTLYNLIINEMAT